MDSPGKRDFHSDLCLWEKCIWLLPTDFPGGSDSKASAYNSGDPDSVPGSGRSPAERNGNPLQYSCLENPMDRGAWWAIFHGVTKSRTRQSMQGILKQWYQQHPALLITICLVMNKKEDSLLLLLLPFTAAISFQPQFFLLNNTSFISCSQNWLYSPRSCQSLRLGCSASRNQSAEPFFSLAPLCQNPSWHTLNYIRSKAENYMPSKVER